VAGPGHCATGRHAVSNDSSPSKIDVGCEALLFDRHVKTSCRDTTKNTSG
jgi:hypothetical protein